MTTCRIIQVAAAAPDERYMTTCRIIQVRRSAPNERYMTTNRCIHAAATAPYERYMTTNRSIHAAAAAPYERYDDESRYPTLRRRTLNMSLRFPGDNANVLDCSKIELNTLRENGSRDHIFFSSVAKQAHNFIRVRVRAPKKPKFFFPFFLEFLFLIAF
ncbi:hypothetical protein TcYC6_0002680 [Trypanosoma cruzi]|nr:hypothetical protein TcYC6_0002680 [Trypanosoma cruzi]